MESAEPAAIPSGASHFTQPTAEEIRLQLTKILASRIFVQSERLCRFLRLTVESALAGESDQIKEYTLGRDVFDRDHRFDPRVDSIVRVEARRMRLKLRQYYQELGARDLVVIGFRKGTYIPAFKYASPVEPASASALASPESLPLDLRTVAVLPFVNLSPDPDQDFFCDGITEDILNALATIAELKVVARTSVFFFKGKTADVRDIGEQLGAGTVVEGSVRKAGNRLRISAQAIDGGRGVLRWAGTFDREVKDVFEVQDEIARSIADSVRVTLAPSQEIFAAVRSSGNLEAYTQYLKARHYWHQMAQHGSKEALSHFEHAVALFPNYAPAYAGLADAYCHLTFWGAISPSEGTTKAKQAALEALRLDERLAEPRATLGAMISCFDWHWEEGVTLLKQAIELQPSNLNAHIFYGFQFLCRGRFPEAMAMFERSVQLDPLSPRVSRSKGWAYYLARQYTKAIQSLKMTLASDQRNGEARFLLAYAYLRTSLYPEAVAELLELPEGPFSATKWGALGEVYACWGRTGEAQEALDKLDALARIEYVSPVSRLSVHAGLREWDRVFEELEQAYADHCPWMCLLKVDPRYDPIRPDPRFGHLLQRMHLA